MKIKKIFIALFLLIILFPINVFAGEEPPTLSAQAVYLIDNKTNKVLYSKNANKKMYPASTTKILTAILALENCNLDDVITANYDAIISIPDGYSTANIQIGEQLTVEQLLQLLLVYSANDAANVLAQHIGGSIESFVSMMNTKLNELGLSNSHFTNTYGKHDKNHYTTAHDLAILMQYCMKNDTFRKIAGSASCAIPATNKSSERLYTSTNELLIPNNKHYYSYLTAGKTGFTSQAKNCLVSSGYKNNLELICVVLGCDVNTYSRFTETKTLYEYAYSNFSIRTIFEQNDIGYKIEVSNATDDTKNLDLLIDETVSVLVKNSDFNDGFTPEISLNENISAPIFEGDVLGEISYTIDGVEYSCDLIASNDVEKSKIVFYLIYGFIALVFMVLIIIAIYKLAKKE